MKIIVCVAKNEPHINEWIDYHLALGFDYIYIYANDWTMLHNYKDVTVINWPGEKQQMNCYNHALKNIQFTWAAFIDCDEYIVCPEGLDNFLIGKYTSIVMPWVIMGNRESEGKTIVERFRHWDYDPNGHVKTLVRGPQPTGTFNNPHFFSGLTVTPRGNKHKGPFTTEKPGRLYIKHFYYQDKAYWDVKIARGRADTGTTRTEKWEEGNKFNTYGPTEMV